MSTLDEIKAEAARLGFLLTGAAPAQSPPHYEQFLRWLQAGHAAGMDYLAAPRSLERRAHPGRILPGCHTVLVVAMPYLPPAADNPSASLRLAAYARGADYHDIIPPRLEQLARAVAHITGTAFNALAYTDTGAILERDFASLAGLGWVGKNTCLIHPSFGSYFLLGELLLDLELEPDVPFNADRCGNCRRCIDACPTGCILPDRSIDSRRCLSYLTIENKDAIPRELRPAVGDWLFGCDICQMACPWNTKARPFTVLSDFSPRFSGIDLEPCSLLTLTPALFKQRFTGSPLFRAKRRGLLRNAAVLLGNRKDTTAVPILARTLADEPEPLVRAHAAWALGQIGSPAARQTLSDRRTVEPNEAVQAEIAAALEEQP